MQILWNSTTPLGQILGVLQLSAVGVGWNLQMSECPCETEGRLLSPALVAALATAPDADRAIVTSARNFFRTWGGAVGLASESSSITGHLARRSLTEVSSSIYSNMLDKKLGSIDGLSQDQQTSLTESSLSPVLHELPQSTHDQVINAYAHGTKTVFITYTAVGVCIFLSACFIRVRSSTPSDEISS